MTEWILPCNIQNYDLDSALEDLNVIEWAQSQPITNIEIGDIVYLYEGVPVQAICWKCEVTAVKRKSSIIDDSRYSKSNSLSAGPLIAIKAICEYNFRHCLSLKVLQKKGLNGVPQGPRRIKAASELEKYLHEMNNLMENPQSQENDARTKPMLLLKDIVTKQTNSKAKRKKAEITQYYRNPYIAEYTKRIANGYCQLCGAPAPFNCMDGTPYLESHHIIWLSQGGLDNIYNTVALCPNCHRKMHILQDANDVRYLQKKVKALAP